MSKSAYLEDRALDHVLGGPDFTRPALVFLALFTVAPTEPDGTGGTEVATASYARVQLTNDATEFPNASGGSKTNANAIIFATATEAWGTIQGWALFDALSGGNMLYFGAVTTPKSVELDDTARFNPGTLFFSED